MINFDDLEEARLLEGKVLLSWNCPNLMERKIMTAQQLYELIAAAREACNGPGVDQERLQAALDAIS